MLIDSKEEWDAPSLRRTIRQRSPSSVKEQSIVIDRYGIAAKGILYSDPEKCEQVRRAKGFCVAIQPGSFAKVCSDSKTYPDIVNIQKNLLENGVIIESTQKSGYYEFVKESPLLSVSTSASVVLGRSANGWKEWHTEQGIPISEVVAIPTLGMDNPPNSSAAIV